MEISDLEIPVLNGPTEPRFFPPHGFRGPLPETEPLRLFGGPSAKLHLRPRTYSAATAASTPEASSLSSLPEAAHSSNSFMVAS